MQVSVIPLDQNLPWYEFPITLAGQRFVFEVRYNFRNDRWVPSISDATGSLILAGITLLLRRPLISQYATLPLPAGELWVDTITGGDAQPGIGAFLTTHALYFVEP